MSTSLVKVVLMGIGVVGAVSGCSRGAPAPKVEATSTPTAAEVAGSYSTTRKMTAQPYLVTGEFAMMCRGITAADVAVSVRLPLWKQLSERVRDDHQGERACLS